MTLQPPPGYSGGAPDSYEAAAPAPAQPTPAPLAPDSAEAVSRAADVPDAQLGNPEGAWLRVISSAPSPVHLEDGSPRASATDTGELDAPGAKAPSLGGGWASAQGSAGSATGTNTSGSQAHPDGPQQPARPAVIPARRRPSRPPLGTSVVGGRTVKLHRTAALDRLASGVGYLTIEWLVRQRGLDLLALQDGSSVSARGNTLTIDLTQPMNRVLISTGTQGTMPLAPSELRVSNGSTQVIVPIDGGTSLGVWPRLTLTRVDEFVVIRHEHDPLSGILAAVAGAYGYDERSFVITHTHLLG